MSQSVLELYTALVEAGVEKVKAENAAKAVISREEAVNFSTKNDVQAAESKIRAELYKVATVQSLAIIGATIAVVQLLN